MCQKKTIVNDSKSGWVTMVSIVVGNFIVFYFSPPPSVSNQESLLLLSYLQNEFCVKVPQSLHPNPTKWDK